MFQHKPTCPLVVSVNYCLKIKCRMILMATICRRHVTQMHKGGMRTAGLELRVPDLTERTVNALTKKLAQAVTLLINIWKNAVQSLLGLCLTAFDFPINYARIPGQWPVLKQEPNTASSLVLTTSPN
jgi:hypothetical protein